MTDAEIRSSAYALLEAGETFEAARSDMRLSDQLKVCAKLREITGSSDWLPDLVGGLTAEIEHRLEHLPPDQPVREIELSPRLWYLMLAQIGPGLAFECVPQPGSDHGMFLGVPIRKGTSSWACRSCGADREGGDRCSYCLQPYDRITIDGEILT